MLDIPQSLWAACAELCVQTVRRFVDSGQSAPAGVSVGKNARIVHYMYSAFAWFLHTVLGQIISVFYRLSTLSTPPTKRTTN